MKIIAQARHPSITAASLLCFIHGVGWPLGMVPSILYMARNRALQERSLPGIGQFRGLSGPFEVLGIDLMIALALMFVVINLLFILAGYWLWQSRRKGGILALSLLALSAVFWWGFGLPIPPIVGLLLAVLLLAGWSNLRAEPG